MVYASGARLFLLLALLVVTGILVSLATLRTPASHGALTVVFFDVGQGDAIYIESPTGTQVLIDGGPDGSVLRELPREMGFLDRSLDAVLLTHEDRDHVGGLPDVFVRYDVAMFIRTENQGESDEADAVDALATAEGSELLYARRGMILDLGGGAVLRILFPDRNPSFLASNTSSIVAQLVYGETEFMLTGDSPASIEEYLTSIEGDALASDVLKAGHHGSRTSTSPLFAEAVQPKYAIISAGRDNAYGHPHQEVLDTLGTLGATVLSTAQEGSITFTSDGAQVWRE